MRFNLDLEYQRLQEASDEKHRQQYERYKAQAEANAKAREEAQQQLNALGNRVAASMKRDEEAALQAQIDKAQGKAREEVIAAYKKSHPYYTEGTDEAESYRQLARSLFGGTAE